MTRDRPRRCSCRPVRADAALAPMSPLATEITSFAATGQRAHDRAPPPISLPSPTTTPPWMRPLPSLTERARRFEVAEPLCMTRCLRPMRTEAHAVGVGDASTVARRIGSYGNFVDRIHEHSLTARLETQTRRFEPVDFERADVGPHDLCELA